MFLNGKYWSDVGADKTDSIGSLFIYAYTDDTAKPDKVHLEPPLRSTAPFAGCEREANNARKVLADETASKNDISNAQKLLYLRCRRTGRNSCYNHRSPVGKLLQSVSAVAKASRAS